MPAVSCLISCHLQLEVLFSVPHGQVVGVGTAAFCPGAALLPPFSVGYCKGWKRGCLMLICLQAIRELKLEEEIQHRIKARSYVTPISLHFVKPLHCVLFRVYRVSCLVHAGHLRNHSL